MNAPSVTLYERTRELLAQRPRTTTLRMVADGSGLAFAFVHAVSRGEARDPSVNKVQTLYEYLSGRKLKV